MPKFSIIIPVYNSASTIESCVDSILNQQFQDFELILVNDGSKDNSEKIIDEYIDERIKKIHKKNGGVSSARNEGLKNAKGDYIVFIDSDDKIGKNFLAEYDKLIRTNPNALIYQSFISEYKDRNLEVILPEKYFFNNDIVEAIIILEEKRCLGGAWNKVFKRDIIKNNNILFDENFHYGEDKIFTLEYLWNIDEIIFSSNTEYFYNRKNEQSLSTKHHKSNELLKFAELEYTYFCKILDKYPSEKLREIVNARYSSFLKYVLLSMFRSQDLSSKVDRLNLIKFIKKFDRNNIRSKNFETELPYIILKNYKYYYYLKFLMFWRENFRNIYNKLYR